MILILEIKKPQPWGYGLYQVAGAGLKFLSSSAERKSTLNPSPLRLWTRRGLSHPLGKDVRKTLLDKATGLAVFRSGWQVSTANLLSEYREPIPVGVLVKIQAVRSAKTERRILGLGGIYFPDESVAVSTKGIFAEASHFFDQGADQFQELKK